MSTDPHHDVSSLTVLYDADCAMCRWVRGWLEQQEQLVPLMWVPCGSPEARTLLPALDHSATREEMTVVADTGEVWTAEGAWVACLWATASHRGLALWLSHPRRRRQARSVAMAVAARRPRRRSGSWQAPVGAPPACVRAAG